MAFLTVKFRFRVYFIAILSTVSSLAQTGMKPTAAMSGSLPPFPWYVSHRGDMNKNAEGTLEAYRASIAEGAKFLEVDCYLLEDGTLGIMHDDWLGRTTELNWPTSRMNRARWNELMIAGGKLLPMQKGYFKVPILDDVLKEFSNRVIIFVEAKNRGAGAAIVAALRAHAVKPEYAVVNSFMGGELEAAVNAGYPTMFSLGSEAQTLEPDRLAALGFDYYNVSIGFSDESIKRLISKGLKVFIYTFERHFMRDHYLSLGVTGFASNDASYLQQRDGTNGRLVSDPYAKQTYYRGQLPTRSGRYGYFTPPNKWGLYEADTGSYVGNLQGWCSPLNGRNPYRELKIKLTITFGNAMTPDRWASIFLSTDDQAFSRDENPPELVTGLNFVTRKSGGLDIYEYRDGKSKSVAHLENGYRLKTGDSSLFEITYESGWFEFCQGVLGESVRIKYDGPPLYYVTFGVKGLGADFSDVTISVE